MISGLSLAALKELILGPVGSLVKLDFTRPDGTSNPVVVTRAPTLTNAPTTPIFQQPITIPPIPRPGTPTSGFPDYEKERLRQALKEAEELIARDAQELHRLRQALQVSCLSFGRHNE